MCALFVAGFALAYLGTNHLGLLAARVLPMAGWERAIPFVPWALFGYALTYAQVLLVFFAVRRRDVGTAFVGMCALLLVHGLAFLLFPTTYPRPAFPFDWAPMFRVPYDILVLFDSPRNCFPSLHAALSTYVTIAYWRRDWRLGVASLLVTAAMFASALALKQHYAIDLIVGACVAILASIVVHDAFADRTVPKGAKG